MLPMQASHSIPNTGELDKRVLDLEQQVHHLAESLSQQQSEKEVLQVENRSLMALLRCVHSLA